MTTGVTAVRWFDDLGSGDIEEVGGKNASLGEMTRALKAQGVRIPGGFATTATAYWRFLEDTGLLAQITPHLDALKAGTTTIRKAGLAIRDLFETVEIPPGIAEPVRTAYRELGRRYGQRNLSVAVRSSLAAEDVSTDTLTSQQHTFLNVQGEEQLLQACVKCYASVFTDRAIAYREEKGMDHLRVALSVGVQRMVRSDEAGSGVAHTMDPDSGFPKVVVVEAAWGLGEGVVAGNVNPDRYMLFKRLLGEPGVEPIIDKYLGTKKVKSVHADVAERTTKMVETSEDERKSFVLQDQEVLRLAQWACDIETHYGAPMEIEWAKDGDTGELFIVQARRKSSPQIADGSQFHTYRIREPGERLLSGLGIGEGLAKGRAYVLRRPEEAERFPEGGILVTSSTDADWVPIMKRAAGVVTDYGGRTSDAAVACRELGIPAVVGTGEATRSIRNGQEITVSCTEGEEGFVYAGTLEFEEVTIGLDDLPETRTQVMLNVASPAAALRWWRLPCQGIGLATTEFIIANAIKVHPMALLRFKELTDRDARRRITSLTWAYEDKAEYFVSQLAYGIAKIAASRHPDPVLVRFSDFTSAQYAGLIGGKQFEPIEDNPLMGLRGASRFSRAQYRDAFALECRAIKRVREDMGLDNVAVLLPFCRTSGEARRVMQIMAHNGLQRGAEGLQVFLMCQLPANAIQAGEFAPLVDGFCLGTEELAQFVLGVDRDEPATTELLDPMNGAMRALLLNTVQAARNAGILVGVSGDAANVNPEFTTFLVENGVDFLAVAPDNLITVRQRVAEIEGRLGI